MTTSPIVRYQARFERDRLVTRATLVLRKLSEVSRNNVLLAYVRHMEEIRLRVLCGVPQAVMKGGMGWPMQLR